MFYHIQIKIITTSVNISLLDWTGVLSASNLSSSCYLSLAGMLSPICTPDHWHGPSPCDNTPHEDTLSGTICAGTTQDWLARPATVEVFNLKEHISMNLNAAHWKITWPMQNTLLWTWVWCGRHWGDGRSDVHAGARTWGCTSTTSFPSISITGLGTLTGMLMELDQLVDMGLGWGILELRTLEHMYSAAAIC